MVTNYTTGRLQNDLWIKQISSYYSATQVIEYLTHVGYLPLPTESDLVAKKFDANLKQLGILQRLHLLSFPFESTDMHYSAGHAMDVSPGGLFQRLVKSGKGSGSYCFGQNSLFLDMLRGLGYRAYAGGARVNEGRNQNKNSKEFTPLTHMIIFVQPNVDSNATYIVDVGFGSANLAQPLLLSAVEDNVVWGIAPPERHRLTRGAHPSSSLEPTKDSQTLPNLFWQLESTREPDPKKSDAVWTVQYAFSELEFYSADIQSGSFVVSKWPGKSVFWNDVIAVKHFRLGDHASGAAENEAACYQASIESRENNFWMGRYVMAKGVVKRQVGQTSETVREITDEEERIWALKEFFGINIDKRAV